MFISALLLKQITKTSEISEVSWELELVRFIACSMFHFWFASESSVAIESIKYVAMNQDSFARPRWAVLCSILQLSTVIFVEIVNIAALVQLDSLMDILLSYIVLGIVSEFDN